MTNEDVGIPSIYDLYQDEELRQLAIARFGIEIPDGATHIRLSEDRQYRQVGAVTKLIPDERYSHGLFVRRNPAYTQIEDSVTAIEGFLHWRELDGTRNGAWVQLDGGRK